MGWTAAASRTEAVGGLPTQGGGFHEQTKKRRRLSFIELPNIACALMSSLESVDAGLVAFRQRLGDHRCIWSLFIRCRSPRAGRKLSCLGSSDGLSHELDGSQVRTAVICFCPQLFCTARTGRAGIVQCESARCSAGAPTARIELEPVPRHSP